MQRNEMLASISASNDLDFYFDTIRNNDLVFGIYEYFNEGVRKDLFSPLEFFNLLQKQHDFINENQNKPFAVITELRNLPLNELEKHILFGFLLKRRGGYPVMGFDDNYQFNTVMRFIEKDFLAYEGETPEMTYCRKDNLSYLRKNEVERMTSHFEQTGIWEDPQKQVIIEEINPNGLGSFTNSQIVLIFHYFFKYQSINARDNTDIAPLAKFIHLVTGRAFTTTQNSAFYEKLRSAPNFNGNTQLKTDLEQIRPLFERVQLNAICKMIDNEKDLCVIEKNKK